MDKRVTPEQSLEEAQEAEKKAQCGQLKIYLGAAPGVGKTYEMLHDAQESLTKNLDVVIGVVESHGRDMIEGMVSHFEILPKQKINYRGREYEEFDLDAALKRNPGLVLIDEMAHTNVEGLRHAKRWQDIKELLDRGIDVYTTLNVQHIESLKDDVTQIIQAPVKETVPDFMIELADTIELVDLPVDELLQRLHEGKIYIPQQARQAVEHFFRRGNLIALRELALRTTAACVETEVLLYRKSEGIKKIWPTREKILVCVGANPESLKLIRTAKRMVTSLQAEWLAVYVDVPRIRASTNQRNCAVQHLRLAQQLGAETHVLIGSDLVKEIMQFARENNVTQIMVWKYESWDWRHFFKTHVADKILSHCGEINVFIVTGPDLVNKIPDSPPVSIVWKPYAWAGMMVLLATGFNQLLVSFVESSVLLMIYLLGILLVTTLGSVGASMLASVASVLLYDFIFLNHRIGSRDSLITWGIMFTVTVAISYLILIKNRKDHLTKQIHDQTRALFTFSRQLLSTRGVDQLISLGTAYIADIFKAKAGVFIRNKNQLVLRENSLTKGATDQKEQSVAQWVYDMKQPAGYGTDTLSSSDALYMPLIASGESIGVLKITPEPHVFYTPDQMRLLESCVNQLTLALEVDRLQEKARKKELRTEVDLAKNTLLKTLSSHLNFPLNAILDAVSAAHDQSINIDHAKIKGELSQISLLNNNILHMIRFDSKSIKLNKKRITIDRLMRVSIELFQRRCQDKKVRLNKPDNLPEIFADKDLLRSMFDNLLDNADKYSPKDTSIDIYIQVEPHHLWFSIENVSSGIPKDELLDLFKKFYRGKHLAPEQGLGLGLTICQRIIEAHRGRIWVENIDQKGIVAFRFILPI